MRSARPSHEVHAGGPGARSGLSPGRLRGKTLAAIAAGVALACALAALALGSARARARLREAVARALEARVPLARLEGGASIDWRLRLVAGPIVIGRPAGAPAITVDRAVVRPRLAALLAGRLEPAAVSLEGVRIDAGLRGAALVAALKPARMGGTVRLGPRGAAPAPELRFEDLRLRVALTSGPGASIVDLGPLSGSARLRSDGPEPAAEVALASADGARAEARIDLGGGQREFSLRLDHLAASAIPAPLRRRLPFAVEGGDLCVAVQGPLPRGAAPVEARVEVLVTDLALRFDSPSPASNGTRGDSEDLAPGVLRPLTARIAGTLRWDAALGRLSLDAGRLDVGRSGRAGVDVALSLDVRPEPRFQLALRAREVDWKAALDALPPMLRPPAEAPSVQGSLAGWLDVSGPVERPSSWRIDGDVDPSGLEAAPGVLAYPFTWQAPLPDGRTRPVVIGPENPDFVPLGALPGYVVRAVLASEDAAFYAHHGFDLHEVQDALARAGERTRLRGASTITQQLAKNLYLSPERTLLRKAREALATIALETSVGKRRLLEIYLNLAEWGPGVFGIGEAARHWFGKDARALSPKEAAFLASVIPNPTRYEMYRRRGALTEVWEERVRQLLVKLRAAEVLTPEQFQQAWDAPLEFAHG